MSWDPSSVARILEALRREMRTRGMSVAALAKHLGISEPTAWRRIRNKGLTLDGLNAICAVLDVNLDDMLGMAPEAAADCFSLRQERLLASDREISLLFFAILHGAQRSDLATDFRLEPEHIERHVQRLVRMGLLRVTAGGKLKPTTTRSVRWRRGGPLATAFEATVKNSFFEIDFGALDANYISQMIKLSKDGRVRVQASFERLECDILRIAEEDAATRPRCSEWTALLMMATPMSLDTLRRWIS